MDKEEFKELVRTLDALMAEAKYIEYLELCEPVIDIGLELQLFEEIMLIMRHISECYYQLGHVDIAIEKLAPLKKLVDEYGSKADYINFLNLSFIYWDETTDKAYAGTFLYEALPLVRQENDKPLLRKILNNLTAFNIMQGHFEKAEEYALETQQLLKEEFSTGVTTAVTEYISPTINYAMILEHQNRLEECEKVIQQGFEILPATRLISKLNLMFILSKVRKKQQRLEDQLAILLEARDISLQHTFTVNSIEILKELIKIYKANDDFEQIIMTQAMYIDVLEKSQKHAWKSHLIQNERLNSLHIDYRTSIDPLTKIHNRKYFERSYYGYLKGEQHLFCYINIVAFERYKEAHGHLAGDDVLKTLAKRVSDIFVAHGGLFARYEKDLFCGVVSGDAAMNQQLVMQVQQILTQMSVRIVASAICFKKRDGLVLTNLIEQAKNHLTDATHMTIV